VATHYPRVASLKTVDDFTAHLDRLGLNLPVDPVIEAAPLTPLASGIRWRERCIGNRWCVLPMEGWDGETDGRPGSLTRRRWTRFGESGAKLIWGGEAVAVRPEARANPHQLWIHGDNAASFEELRLSLQRTHFERFGRSDDLVIGLQLTHSGRYCRPYRSESLEPKILYHHPILDRRLRIPSDHPLLSDDDIRRIIDSFVHAACLAHRCGFDFVDIKHCHGYLGHEFLSAVDRTGEFGGSFENRTRFLREIVGGIRSTVPGLELGVRLSAFDTLPFRSGANGVGIPEEYTPPYHHAFGCDPTEPSKPDLLETGRFLELLRTLDIPLVGVSVGSPYYNPHIQRPALFPPSDGYDPPEDPLAGVVRQITLTAQLKRRFPDLIFVGSGYTYLQEYLPHVAQAAVRQGWTDFVGLGRMVLAYPDFPADVLEGKPLDRTRICRTFSDCTTAPRQGLVSGCYPLDPMYRQLPEAEQLKQRKKTRNIRIP
jgi:2,4-dienoyl-CoA reductase-like NADH-dependent reductase (Old Yellow Enzyme family)